MVFGFLLSHVAPSTLEAVSPNGHVKPHHALFSALRSKAFGNATTQQPEPMPPPQFLFVAIGITIAIIVLAALYTRRQRSVVIVGSGIGGLLSGAILARAGWKVTVLEQHTEVGGCMHTYK